MVQCPVGQPVQTEGKNDKKCRHSCPRPHPPILLADTADAPIDTEHEQVLAGDSIGAIFKAGGWTIRKATLHIGTTELRRSRNEVALAMRLEYPSKIAVHVYRLLLQKDGDAIDYATISEFHHPDYLDLEDLRELYPVDPHGRLPAGQIEELLNLGLNAA